MAGTTTWIQAVLAIRMTMWLYKCTSVCKYVSLNSFQVRFYARKLEKPHNVYVVLKKGGNLLRSDCAEVRRQTVEISNCYWKSGKGCTLTENNMLTSQMKIN